MPKVTKKVVPFGQANSIKFYSVSYNEVSDCVSYKYTQNFLFKKEFDDFVKFLKKKNPNKKIETSEQYLLTGEIDLEDLIKAFGIS